MQIVIPKASRGYVFNRLSEYELNDFDVERLLPSLFFIIVTRGRQRAGKPNDPTEFNEYLMSLINHDRITGFKDTDGSRLMERWLRTSIIQVGKMGRSKRKGEQIEYVIPHTLLTYKTGFPAEIRRQRNVHVFLYRLLLRVYESLQATPSAEAAVADWLKTALGQGVIIGPAPNFEGKYDGKTDVDIHTLLALAYLNGFKPTGASRKIRFNDYGPALPIKASQIATDLIKYVLAYSNRMPPIALTKRIMTLINFELFIYTIKLIYATNALVRTEELPPNMMTNVCNEEALLYVDYTRLRGTTSDEIAKACVERDLEELRVFFDSAMLLRTLDRFVEYTPLQDELMQLETPEYLRSLLKLRRDPRIEARAGMELEAIRVDSEAMVGGKTEREDVAEYFKELRRSAKSSLDAVNRLFVDAQKSSAIRAYVSWFWSVGGLRKEFGLLAGNLKGRRNWRYAMSDDLLAVLVELALIEDPSSRFDNVTTKPSISLHEFLNFLSSRFGILVDKSPTEFDSTEARIGALENLEALKKRLRQMGFFEDLSDDFTAQYLRSPLDSTEVQ